MVLVKVLVTFDTCKFQTSFFQIAAEMSKKGFSAVTGRMCEVKFKNMKTTYKTIKMRQQQSGSGRESRWPYFQILRTSRGERGHHGHGSYWTSAINTSVYG
jgi:hypothetical protein